MSTEGGRQQLALLGIAAAGLSWSVKVTREPEVIPLRLVPPDLDAWTVVDHQVYSCIALQYSKFNSPGGTVLTNSHFAQKAAAEMEMSRGRPPKANIDSYPGPFETHFRDTLLG